MERLPSDGPALLFGGLLATMTGLLLLAALVIRPPEFTMRVFLGAIVTAAGLTSMYYGLR